MSVMFSTVCYMLYLHLFDLLYGNLQQIEPMEFEHPRRLSLVTNMPEKAKHFTHCMRVCAVVLLSVYVCPFVCLSVCHTSALCRYG